MTEQRFDFDKEANTGIRHLVNATRFSLQGLRSAFARESAFRQELLLFMILLPSGAYYAESSGMFIALLCACMLVLAVELLNSGIEAAIDRAGPERNDISRLAKDYGSAAVMMSLLIAVIVWGHIVFNGLVTIS